jgi:hypothetical protein
MKRQALWISGMLLLVAAGASVGWSFLRDAHPGGAMTVEATRYLSLLDAEQRATSLLPYDTPQRLEWHFIPKPTRKGLQVKDMTQEQRKAARGLLRSCLSEVGYGKADRIMKLENLLHALEKDRSGGPIRDPQRYYFTLFGEPTADGRWGLSIEGHHLSLNFVVEKGRVISSTPTFFAANPALIQAQVPGTDFAKGARVLADEELLAFELVGSLDEQQRKAAVIADKAPAEIRAAGEPQPPADEGVGLEWSKLTEAQRMTLIKLILT